MVQQIMSNPEIMRQMMLSNPQMRELMEVGFHWEKTHLLLPMYIIMINSLCSFQMFVLMLLVKISSSISYVAAFTELHSQFHKPLQRYLQYFILS